jgi:hypothetical protein
MEPKQRVRKSNIAKTIPAISRRRWSGLKVGMPRFAVRESACSMTGLYGVELHHQ